MGNKPAKSINRDEVLWELFFEKLLENFEAVVMVVDADGNIVFANEKCLEVILVTDKDIADIKWPGTLVPEEIKDDVLSLFDGIRSKKTVKWFEVPVISSDGSKKYLCFLCVPLVEKGKSLYLLIGSEGQCQKSDALKVHPATEMGEAAAYKEIVKALFEASRISEPGTAEHASRVMSFATLLARKLKVSREAIEKLRAASLLHDLGKLVVDEKILFKKGKLGREEFDEIKKHPGWGSDVVGLVYILHDIIPIMASHHENYDGTGYPKGVKGDDIPQSARILAVADIYEALTSDRPYRKGFTQKEAIAIMKYEKGRKLDPLITDVFLKMIIKKEINGENS